MSFGTPSMPGSCTKLCVLEGSLVLAEDGRIKESQGLGDANPCLGHKARHRRARRGRDGQETATSRLDLGTNRGLRAAQPGEVEHPSASVLRLVETSVEKGLYAAQPGEFEHPEQAEPG